MSLRVPTNRAFLAGERHVRMFSFSLSLSVSLSTFLFFSYETRGFRLVYGINVSVETRLCRDGRFLTDVGSCSRCSQGNRGIISPLERFVCQWSFEFRFHIACTVCCILLTFTSFHPLFSSFSSPIFSIWTWTWIFYFVTTIKIIILIFKIKIIILSL